jgi:SAM-dependent methyltransferase
LIVCDPGFYDSQETGSRDSAAAVVPIIVNLLKPKSVLDVGCGVGPWLVAFAAAGLPVCHGIDGPWVNKTHFSLGPNKITSFDFNSETAPFKPALPQGRFDLVLTLELLEHVRPEAAPALVEFLTSLSDTVVFSAAIPGQGGTNHVNEQWIDYWSSLFGRQGFVPFDFLRPLIWNDERIDTWYRQNLIGFFKGAPPANVVALAEATLIQQLRNPLRLVHPGILDIARKPPQPRPPLAQRVIGELQRRIGV